MTATLLLEARGIRLQRGAQSVLEDVSLELHRGHIVTLIGPNGAGKTTLVRLLLGLERPDQSRLWRMPGLRVGYMTQRLHVDPGLPLAVQRFLRMGGASANTARESLAAVGPEALARASMPH